MPPGQSDITDLQHPAEGAFAPGLVVALIVALLLLGGVLLGIHYVRRHHADPGERPEPGDVLFRALIGGAMLLVLGLVIGVLSSLIAYPDLGSFLRAVTSSEVAFAVKLTLATTLTTTALSVVLGLPCAYALSRYRIPLSSVIDTIIDLPIVLPPLTAGVALLMFFGGTEVGSFINEHIAEVVFTPKGIILAQFFPTATFAIRTLQGAFDAVDPRLERVARTLGCSERQAFWRVTVPLARTGLVAAVIMSWARCVGIFGPIVMFCGATRFKTEVLPVAIFLNMSIGEIEMAASIAIIMLIVAVAALYLFKKLGGRGYLW